MNISSGYDSKSVTGAIFIALLSLIIIEAVWSFVIPHTGHFAPEVGPIASFIIIGLINSIQLIFGFGAGLLSALAYVQNLKKGRRRTAECFVFVATALFVSGLIVHFPNGSIENTFFTLIIFTPPFLLSSWVLTRNRMGTEPATQNGQLTATSKHK